MAVVQCLSLPFGAALAIPPSSVSTGSRHTAESLAFSASSLNGTQTTWRSSLVPTLSPANTSTGSVITAGLGDMLGGIFKGGAPSEKTRQNFADRVALVNSLEPSTSGLSDEALKEKTSELKRRVNSGESLDDILPEAFAIVREASKRILGLRPFDVQLIGTNFFSFPASFPSTSFQPAVRYIEGRGGGLGSGGMVLHKGEIAEMRTGEGKTLVAVLPAYLNALSGKGVHVVTVNDYLAKRDCEWVGQVHRFLGLKVGLIQQGMTPEERRENYLADITYVTNSELGFDFLRDNLAQAAEDLVLRGFSFCIVDEVDSILIDEARTPLIISGPADKPGQQYVTAKLVAATFSRDVHYNVDEKQKNVLLTEVGYEDAEKVLQVSDLYDPRTQWASYLLNAIKAKEVFNPDVHYIVRGKEVVIVDEFTGRVMAGRRWSDGLHQAIEAKEGVPIQNESVTLASITYQNFFLQYPKLCGMTGTAATEANEFNSIYRLTTTEIPTNRGMVRKDESDVVFRSENGKWRAAVVEVVRMHKSGRPVLVGTTSVEQSEALSAKLREAGVQHRVLNAKPENVEKEAEIVAQSGRVGAVTIATNMAGRGTDIILGGNADFMARLKLREALLPRVVGGWGEEESVAFEPQSKKKNGAAAAGAAPVSTQAWKVSSDLLPCDLPPEVEEEVEAAVSAAASAWGEKGMSALEVEERLSYACEKGPVEDEVEAQLRAAYVSVNRLYRRYTEEEKGRVVAAGGLHVVGTERHESRRIDNQSLMSAFRVEDLPIESKMLTRALDEAQRKVENYFFDIRKQLFEYDEVLNSQRDRVYNERRRALEALDLEGLMLEYAELTVEDIVGANVDASQPKETWDLEALAEKMKQYCVYLRRTGELEVEDLKAHSSSPEELKTFLTSRCQKAYFQKREEVEEVSPGLMQQAQRFFVLSQTDKLWKDHLQRLKFIQTAVGLRGYAQRDPLIEYKLEGYNLFLDMMAQIRRNVIYSVYQFEATKAAGVDPPNGGAPNRKKEGEHAPVNGKANRSGKKGAKVAAK